MSKLTVKAIRVASGRTQQEFADLIEMPVATYIKKEQGHSDFTFNEMVKICDVTGFDLKQIRHELIK